MRVEFKALVCDTSCLIAFSLLKRWEVLLDSGDRVIVPTGVHREFGAELPAAIEVMPVAEETLVPALRLGLGVGESETIALALNLGRPAACAVLDDHKARRSARSLGVPYTGTIGLMIRAKWQGRIRELAPLLGELRKAGFYLARDVQLEALRLAGEEPGKQ